MLASRPRLSAALLALLGLLGIIALSPAEPVSASSIGKPFGFVVGTSSTASTSNIGSSEVVITPLSMSFNVSQGDGSFTVRQMKFTAVLRVQATVAATTANAYIDVTHQCGCQAPVRVAGSNTYLAASGGLGSETMVVTGHVLLGIGPYDMDVKVKRSGGTGVISVSQTAGTPQQALVEDMGV